MKDNEKLKELEQIVDQHLRFYDEKKQAHIRKMDAYLEKVSGTDRFFDLKESLSLQRIEGVRVN